MPTCRKRAAKKAKSGVTWFYTIDAGREADTRRDQRTRGGYTNEKACQKALTEEMHQRHRNVFVEPATVPVRDYLTSWLQDTADSRVSGTNASYRTMCDRVSKHLGDVPLGKLTGAGIQRAYRQLGATLAPTTIRQVHKVFHAALEQGVRWNLLARNPSDHVTLPAVPDEEVQAWTEDEARTFLAHTHASPEIALWRLYLDTGMRVSEAIALQWRDVDLDAGTVRIRRTLTRDAVTEYPVVKSGAKHGSNRMNEINADTVAALRHHRAVQNARRLQVGELWRGEGFVFDRGDGQFIHPTVVRARFRAQSARARVPVIQLKALRHTAATIMVANGVALHTVKERLGHSTIRLTADLYAHATRKADREATEVLRRVLGG